MRENIQRPYTNAEARRSQGAGRRAWSRDLARGYISFLIAKSPGVYSSLLEQVPGTGVLTL